MTDPKDHPLPQGGGSYIRNADGSLTLDIAPTIDAAVAAEAEAAKAVQAPVKRAAPPLKTVTEA